MRYLKTFEGLLYMQDGDKIERVEPQINDIYFMKDNDTKTSGLIKVDTIEHGRIWATKLNGDLDHERYSFPTSPLSRSLSYTCRFATKDELDKYKKSQVIKQFDL